MEVLDWDEAETFEVPDLPLDVESQEELNAKLKVNMFTEYNVKSADLNAKTIASFYDQLTVSFADCPTDSYFTYTELQNAGLTTADAVLTDGQGNKYRLPTEGELSLLLPMWTELAERDDLGNKHWGVCHPWWNDNLSTNNPGNAAVDSYVMSSKVSKEGWKETIYLKNGADNYPDKTTNAGETDGDYVVSGKSLDDKRYANRNGTLLYGRTGRSGERQLQHRSVYGIRFKGYEPVRRLPLGELPDSRQPVGTLFLYQDQGPAGGFRNDCRRLDRQQLVLGGRLYRVQVPRFGLLSFRYNA